jgi:alpha-1,6-mannosyltransferase
VTLAAAPMPRATTHEATTLVGLALLGAVLLVITATALVLSKTIDWNLIVVMMLASGLVTLAATHLAVAAPARPALAIVIGVALALRLLALAFDPIGSDDVYRYVWDGIVQGHGINPYRYVPADPALAALRDGAIFPNINRADYAVTAYPPVAQMFFFAVTRLGQSVTAMRLALIGCEAITVALLIDLLRRIDKPVTLAVAYAWHPLAVWETAQSGHVEALMVMLVMLGAWLAVRHRRIAAGAAITLGVLVKPYALAALPACWRVRSWRNWDWRLPLAVIAVVTLCYLPYLGVGWGALGFLTSGYLREEGLQGGAGFWLVNLARTLVGDASVLLPLYIALAAAALGALALRIASTADDTPQHTTRNIAVLLMAGLFFLSPNYPWYYLVIVPFIPLGGGAPAWMLSLGALLLYLLYPEYETRFLVWKSVIGVGFLVAVIVTLRPPLSMHLPGALRWTR